MSIECPRCRLWSPDSAQRCDCGFDFTSARVETSYLAPGEYQERFPKKATMPFTATVAAAGFYRIIVGRDDPSVTLAAMAVALVVGTAVIGLIQHFRRRSYARRMTALKTRKKVG